MTRGEDRNPIIPALDITSIASRSRRGGSIYSHKNSVMFSRAQSLLGFGASGRYLPSHVSGKALYEYNFANR